MADRREILDDIRRTYGNALNIQQLTSALGFKDRRAAKTLWRAFRPSTWAKRRSIWQWTWQSGFTTDRRTPHEQTSIFNRRSPDGLDCRTRRNSGAANTGSNGEVTA